MITASALNPKRFSETREQTINLLELSQRINIFLLEMEEAGIRFNFLVTSGLRSLDDHKRIYAEIAKRKGLTSIRIPMGSKHLSGQAVDISDPGNKLLKYCKANPHILEKCQLWAEDDDSVARLHLQSVAPLSGNRFFKP